MRYLLSIYGDEARYATVSEQEAQDEMNAYWEYERAVREAGVHIAGEALQPTATATTVRIRDGERSLTDGPFAETKEQLGGFYLLECKDLDEAIEWASRCPGAIHGSMEVRAIQEYDLPEDLGQAAGQSAEAS